VIAALAWPPERSELDAVATGRRASLFAADVRDRADALREAIGGKRLLFVGGAGTIGAATLRAALPYRPAAVDVIDASEANLVELVRSLRSDDALPAGTALHALPLDYGAAPSRRWLGSAARYDAVLHFAALKHVRSEKDAVSTLEMLRVNVLAFDTLLTDLAQGGHDARLFAVSSDKAADPSSAMGATKRLMERLLFDRPRSAGAITTSARFANVAFSNGSLLHGFLHRLAERQPLAAPATRRYFLSRHEAGELCLLAAFAIPDRHQAIPRADPTLTPRSLTDVATAFLACAGLTAEPFDDAAAARAALPQARAAGRWPLLITPHDTSGEKEEEVFVAAGERSVEIGMRQVQGIEHRSGSRVDRSLLRELERRIALPTLPIAKGDVIDLLRRAISHFPHVETGRDLDLRP
jgi:nucleoside-diphosphate-sugar epimerase